MKGAEGGMVFVVDDDLAMRRSIENLIRSAGLQVKVFASAEAFMRAVGLRRAQSNRSVEPLSRAAQSSRPGSCSSKANDLSSEVGAADLPACAVLDVQLRGISGLDLQRRLADSGIEIPIIFITAHGDIRMSVYAMKAGAMEFLTKPFSDQDLIEAVQNGIERSRAAQRQLSTGTKLENSVFSTARDELNRLAGEIHDGLAQHLSAIHIQLAAAKEGLSSTGGDWLHNLERAIELASRGLVETRRCARNLRSSVVQESALRSELQQLAERWDVGGRWRCRFESDSIPENKLSSRAKHQLLRIAQEAINNAARHADPTLILLTLRWRPPNLILQVTDNGKGFTTDRLEKSEGLGLWNMRKRAEEVGGRFEIQTAAGAGTSIIVTVPVSRGEQCPCEDLSDGVVTVAPSLT